MEAFDLEHNLNKYYNHIIKMGTEANKQLDKTQIRLLLQEQSDQGMLPAILSKPFENLSWQ